MAEREQAAVLFVASIPPILAAIRVGGDGGLRLTLDIPESDAGVLAQLAALRRRPLAVAISPLDDDDAPAPEAAPKGWEVDV